MLNCVGGLELDLLRQCRERCGHFEDVVKFVVPMESVTRSHGPNRMLTEYMTKYQGYVFANLRLSAKTYNAIQELDLCRSWMGNVNYRRGKKLPPAPIALNELEIQKFGLEEIMEGNEEGDDDMDDDDEIIVDTEEQDKKDANNKPKVNEEQLKEFLGLKVDDMIQVTAKNKFHGEDGIIKRLKGGKIMIRFFTYGTTYDEWLDPSDVRKLGDEEAIRGLSGPTKPISQEEFDAGGEGYMERGAQRGGPGRNLRNDLMNSFSGESGNRNRREDRVARGDTLKRDLFSRSDDERKREDRNWKQHQDRQPQREPAINDGEWNMRSGSHSDRGANQADVSGQWGRNSERTQRVERPSKRQENRQVSNAIEAKDDWSAFISSASPPDSAAKEDNFFSSLMNELSDDFEKKGPNKMPSSKDDDDFFASLMSELAVDEKQNQPGQLRPPTPQQQPPAQQLQRPQQQPPRRSKDGIKKEDDFFAALEAELGNVDTQGFLGNDDGDEFFAKLEAEMNPDSIRAVAVPSRLSRGKGDATQESDVFFTELTDNLNQEMSVPADPPRRISNRNPDTKPKLAGGDDFFAELEAEMRAEKSRSVDKSNQFSKNNDDFFAALENEMATSAPASMMDFADGMSLDEFDLDSIFGSGTQKEPLEKENAKKSQSARVALSDDAKQSASTVSPLESSAPSGDLGKHTVPVLKSMLKERGLKVSGSKAELIERLQAQQ